MAAGLKYVSMARKMRSFNTTRGTVLSREVVPTAASLGREGRWGSGGNYQPKVTYTYSVDGAEYRSDRLTYSTAGLKRSVAERAVAAVPDDVTVHYDPADPSQAYLQTNSPNLGYALLAGGAVTMFVALAALFS